MVPIEISSDRAAEVLIGDGLSTSRSPANRDAQQDLLVPQSLFRLTASSSLW
jgi:hypothetical protein